MTVRTDVIVDWVPSPRVALVLAPSTSITVQDLYDTLRTEESRVYNAGYPILISAGGKEELGAGRQVGITVTLRNTVLKFEERLTDTVCRVSDGNLVAVNAAGAPITPIAFSDNVMAIIENSTSPALVSDGFTAADRVVLDNVEDKVVLTDLRTGRIVKVMENRLEVDFATQQLILYDNDGVTVLQRWTLGTADGGPVTYRQGVQTKRGMPQL